MDTIELLESIRGGSLERKVVNELVEKCYKIAFHYMSINIRKIFKKIANEGDTIEELSIEAITPLFLITENEQLQICNTYCKWKNNISSEQDALYFLNKIISKRVNQHITHILKKSDPFFAKIYDSLNYFIKKDGLKKQNYFGTIYIVDKKISGKVINNQAFEELPATLFVSRDNLVHNIMNFMEDETEYFPAIPMNALVKRIKHLSFEGNARTESIPGHLLKYELKEMVDAGLKDAFNKLEYSYSRNNKLNSNEIRSFEMTLNDMAMDLKDGGLKPGLYEYLKLNMPELNSEQFHQKYQNILEYLLKVLKKKVAAELTK